MGEFETMLRSWWQVLRLSGSRAALVLYEPKGMLSKEVPVSTYAPKRFRHKWRLVTLGAHLSALYTKEEGLTTEEVLIAFMSAGVHPLYTNYGLIFGVSEADYRLVQMFELANSMEREDARAEMVRDEEGN